MSVDHLQSVLEDSVDRPRFSMSSLIRNTNDALQGTPLSAKLDLIAQTLGDKSCAKYVLQGLLRTAFLIELVKTPKIETTKVAVRWSDCLRLDDPRYATFDTCLQIFVRLVDDLVSALSHTESGADNVALINVSSG